MLKAPLLIIAGICVFFNASIAFAGPSPSPTSPPSRNPRNECIASVWQSVTKSPYSGVCEIRYDLGKYICQDYARDHCTFIDEYNERMTKETNGSHDLLGCWILGIRATDTYKNKMVALDCGYKKCGANFLEQRIPDSWCRKEVVECQNRYLEGHAINIIRTTGEKILKRYGTAHFMIYEPQETDPNSAVICSWQQKELAPPKIPEKCRKAVIERYKNEQATCGIDFKLEVFDSKNFSAPRLQAP